MGKGEMARLMLASMYNTCIADTQKQGLVWERVNPLPDNNILYWSKLKQIADDILIKVHLK